MGDDSKGRSRGPGFILGALIGALAGGAAAILLSPPKSEEQLTEISSVPESPPGVDRPPAYMTTSEDESLARVRAMLERVRARMREAGDAGREAAREQEQSMGARYAELTQRERPGPPSA